MEDGLTPGDPDLMPGQTWTLIFLSFLMHSLRTTGINVEDRLGLQNKYVSLSMWLTGNH